MQFIKPSLKLLKQFYQQPELNLKLLLSNHLSTGENQNLSAVDRHAVTRTVYGVVRWQRLLHHIIQEVSDRKINKIQAPVLMLLEIGVYLLFLSTSYPDYAVVNEVVACAGGKTRGFVNALLRQLVRRKKELQHSLNQLNNPAIKYAFPDILLHELQHISLNIEEDLIYLNQEPLFHLRVNTHLKPFNEARESLQETGIDFKELPGFQSFQLKEAGAIKHTFLSSPYYYFQNTASQAIAQLASQFARGVVLDGCAAPGTKAVTLTLLNPTLTIYANDSHYGRAQLIQESACRFQLSNLYTLVADMLHPPFQKDTNPFDFILVDAPCTSCGTLRKNPDLKLKITPEKINANANTQFQILNSLLNVFTKPNGYILYSVCSFTYEETEGVMKRVFTQHPTLPNIEIIDISPFLQELGFHFKKDNHGCYLLPNDKLQNDLFYLSLLKIQSY